MIRNGITTLGITGNKQGNSAGEWAKKGANMTDQAFFSTGGATNFNFDNVNMAQTENPSVWVDGVTVEDGDAGGGDSYSLLTNLYMHYQFGGRKPYNISTSEIDLSYVRQGDLSYDKDKNIYITNLFRLNKTSPTALALGKISLSHIEGNIYKINSDYFDFDYQATGSFYRNTATFIGGAFFGQFYNTPFTTWGIIRNYTETGGPFWINFSGTVYIKP